MDVVENLAAAKTNGNGGTKDGSTNGSNKEINRLLSAAVVNARFRHLLLTDPRAALKAGYNGEPFNLDEKTRARVLSITAATLPEFAAHLTTQKNSGGQNR